ncbi:unnamed protein product [Haemonchus placei]|uniref:Carboxypeptidase n=1 Tax=Haemonchus placei TaxID=6290 RepID=A0A158QQ18_HAEPC|nr:unnamed protein product [Haemonchus placei]
MWVEYVDEEVIGIIEEYIESENDPVNDPVVLFLNGGPGCSSLQGLFLEMGPLRVNNYGETVTRNPWTWNRYANIIYLDSPAGVGFSVRLDGLWNYTDSEVASDNYAAMKEWFKKFPERSKNDFYAAGESYAGTYIPMLSALLVDDKDINFKGMLIGNGCVDDVLNFNSLVDFNYNHGFIDESMDISDNYDFGASHVVSQAENFKKVIKAEKSVALFYGDTDTLCNAVHGAQFAANLGLPEIAPLRPYLDNEQLPPTIGFLTQYKGNGKVIPFEIGVLRKEVFPGLDLLTVRGAGHFVASTNEKPKEALQVFVNFINKTSYDTPVSHDLPYIPPSPVYTPTTTSEDIPVNWDSAPWLITDLPNLDEPLSSKQYSGYLSVSETRKLFYWYIESENDPSKDPVVLWLNGGPGCSSLEGLFLEMGPFRVRNYGAYVTRNKWTWNRVASIIYLDAPAGVGFSIDLNGTEHVFTDDEVAHDNLIAVTEWFKKFPERRNNDFYVAGESYGGTYVPMLSALLLEDFPQFKGMLIGNGCMDDRLLYNSLVGYNYDHTFIDESFCKMLNSTVDPEISSFTDGFKIINSKSTGCIENLPAQENDLKDLHN